MDHADLISPITLVEPLTDRELDVLRPMADDLSIHARPSTRKRSWRPFFKRKSHELVYRL
jgi:hypothetical protein